MTNAEAIKYIFMREGTASENLRVSVFTLGDNRLLWEGKIKYLSSCHYLTDNGWQIVSITRYGNDNLTEYNKDIKVIIV